MFLRIKNWKLALLSLVMITILMKLGFWQLHRADEKKQMLKLFNARMSAPALSTATLNEEIAAPATQASNNKADLRYARVRLTGSFDNQHTLFLDNKIYKGNVGYEIITPFKAKGLNQPILVDRGFISAENNRAILPAVRPLEGLTTITGMLNYPPGYVKLGEMNTEKTVQWPLRIEYLNLNEIETLYRTRFYPYILNIDPKDPAAYPIEWQIVVMTPERHIGYAVQWFALALTLLILSIATNRT